MIMKLKKMCMWQFGGNFNKWVPFSNPSPHHHNRASLVHSTTSSSASMQSLFPPYTRCTAGLNNVSLRLPPFHPQILPKQSIQDIFHSSCLRMNSCSVFAVVSVGEDVSSYIPAAPILLPDSPWHHFTTDMNFKVPDTRWSYSCKGFQSCWYVWWISCSGRESWPCTGYS